MRNEHTIDRVIRVLAGLGAVLLAWFTLGLGDGAVLGILALVVGLVLVATGFAGFCPAYRVLGVRTCKATPGGRPEV